MLVRKAFNLGEVEGRFGIEVEVEGTNLPPRGFSKRWFTNYWRIEEDGSLKGPENWEYVTRKPYDLGDVGGALEALERAYAEHDSKVDDSVRAGIHIHVNVQDMTIKQMLTFAVAYYCIEEVLMTFCGEGRSGNHFCFRASDAENIILNLYKCLKQMKFGLMGHDVVRYSALNFNSLFKYGSLEFRALRSTSDMKKIFNWCEILEALRVNSMKYNSPAAIVESMSIDGCEFLVHSLLGDQIKHFKGLDFTQLVTQGVRNAQIIAYSVNWFEFDEDKLLIWENPRNEDGLQQQAVPPRRRPLRHFVEDMAQAPQPEIPIEGFDLEEDF